MSAPTISASAAIFFRILLIIGSFSFSLFSSFSQSSGRDRIKLLLTVKQSCALLKLDHGPQSYSTVVTGLACGERNRLKETDCALSLGSVANLGQSQKSEGTRCNPSD